MITISSPAGCPSDPPTKLHHSFIYFEIYSPCASLFPPLSPSLGLFPFIDLSQPCMCVQVLLLLVSLLPSPPLSSLFSASTLSCFRRPALPDASPHLLLSPSPPTHFCHLFQLSLLPTLSLQPGSVQFILGVRPACWSTGCSGLGHCCSHICIHTVRVQQTFVE